MTTQITGQPGAGTAEPPKDAPPQDNKDTKPAGTPPTEGEDGSGDAGTPPATPKTFTQDEVNRLLAKERRAAEQKQKEAEERAKLTEQERLQKEAADLRAQLVERDARDAVQSEAAKLGVSNSAAIYRIVKDDLEFDDKGKIKNLAEVLGDAKDNFPELFAPKKPAGTAPDASQGADQGAGKLLTRAQLDAMTTTQINDQWDLVQKSLAALSKTK